MTIINLFILIFAILLSFYTYFLISILQGLNKLKSIKIKSLPDEFISVIIPFRNEEKNIFENLKSIKAQNYPKENFEVIYVNDRSTDNSLGLLCGNKDENIRILNLPAFSDLKASKKRAIKFGIENAKGEIIVTSDSDCFYNPNWLVMLISTFEDKIDFVSGPVEYIEEEKIFSKLQTLEFAGLILTGAGLIGRNEPIICNGANVAFRKNVFSKLNGYEDQLHISSGDDGFLMQKFFSQNKNGVTFCLSKTAVVKTQPVNSIIEFYQQRKRWASKNLYYRNKKLTLKLILIFFFYISLPLQLILSIFLSEIFFITLLISFICKFLMEFLILQKGKKILFHNLKLKYFLPTEIFQIFYIIISTFTGLFGSISWKGRKLKR